MKLRLDGVAQVGNLRFIILIGAAAPAPPDRVCNLSSGLR
jgi:hypothetical protein